MLLFLTLTYEQLKKVIKVQCPRIIVNCPVFRETFHISVPNKFSTESKDICLVDALNNASWQQILCG